MENSSPLSVCRLPHEEESFSSLRCMRLLFAGLALAWLAALPLGCARIRPAAIQPGFVAPLVPPHVEYRIDCAITPSTGQVLGKEQICITNTARMPLTRLQLVWPETPQDLPAVLVNGKPARVSRVSADEKPDSFVIDLPSPILPGRSATLDIGLSVTMHVESDPNAVQMTLVNWFPRIDWGFPSHADHSVSVSAPPDYLVGTTGTLDSPTGRYRASGAWRFGVVLAKGLGVKRAQADNVRIQCYHTPAGEACADVLVAAAKDIIQFYRRRYGFYPYDSLLIIPGEPEPNGGFPVATGIVAIHGMEKFADKSDAFWRWIVAHEIGHQYWYEHVMPLDQSKWLLIGLGVYGDREYMRYAGLGMEMHKEMMARYTSAVRDGVDTTVARTPEAMELVNFDFNNVVTHGKGYSIVSALAVALGRDTFSRVETRCLREYAGRYLDLERFRRLCEDESDQDLKWFFDQWVNSNKFLSYEAGIQGGQEPGARIETDVSLTRIGNLSMPVPVRAGFEDGTAQTRVADRLLKEQHLQFISRSPLKAVSVDPLSELALASPPPSQKKADLRRRIKDLPWQDAGDRALAIFHEVQTIAATEMDSGTLFRLGLVLYDGFQYEEALETFRWAGKAEGTPSRRFGAFVWQGHVLDLLGRREEAVECYKKALEVTGYSAVRHDQYGLVIDTAWVEERLREAFHRDGEQR